MVLFRQQERRGKARLIPFPIADFGLQIAAHGVTMSDDGNDNAELPTGFGIKLEAAGLTCGFGRFRLRVSFASPWRQESYW